MISTYCMAHATMTEYIDVHYRYKDILPIDTAAAGITQADGGAQVPIAACSVTTPTFKPNTLMVKVSATDELASHQRKAGAHPKPNYHRALPRLSNLVI
jgi:hypothetical protein